MAVLFGPFIAAGNALPPGQGQGAPLFGPFTAYGTLSQSNTAFANLLFGPFKVAGNALGAHQAQGAPTFGPFKAAGTGLATIYGTGAPRFGPFVASGKAQYGRAVFGPFTAAGILQLGLTANQLAGIQTVFAPPKKPQAPVDISVQPRVLQAQFGAGYPYTLPDGINVSLRSVNLKFEPLTQAEFNIIDAFFNAYVNQPFWYLLPDENVRRQWMMMNRTRRVQSTVWGYEVSLAEQPQL
jgi:phage-related protein